jgi:hypothetical protein
VHAIRTTWFAPALFSSWLKLAKELRLPATSEANGRIFREQAESELEARSVV